MCIANPKTCTWIQLTWKAAGEVHLLLKPHLQHQNATWQNHLTGDPLWVMGIADHLKQVFLNISINAIEAMQPSGGTITVCQYFRRESRWNCDQRHWPWDGAERDRKIFRAILHDQGGW